MRLHSVIELLGVSLSKLLLKCNYNGFYLPGCVGESNLVFIAGSWRKPALIVLIFIGRNGFTIIVQGYSFIWILRMHFRSNFSSKNIKKPMRKDISYPYRLQTCLFIVGISKRSQDYNPISEIPQQVLKYSSILKPHIHGETWDQHNRVVGNKAEPTT